MNRAWVLVAAALLVILALAAALRLPRLAERPMHADEANQAVKSWRLYATGEYEYDATDHHGPSLYWLTLPSLAISGAKDLAGSREIDYRIVPVIFGLALIPLILLMSDGLGRSAAVFAALLTAISPAMVFYSRYYVQEMLLVFFTISALACGWRYYRTRRLAWILAAGAAVGMMHATKETWILSAAAAVVAGGLTWGWCRLYAPDPVCSDASPALPSGQGGGDESSDSSVRLLVHILAAILVACLVAAAFFSMFGRKWEGPWNSIMAYANYFRRGTKAGDHSEPWYYYLQLFFAYWLPKRVFWSEGFIALLALIGGADALARRKTPRTSLVLPRFLTFYTFLLTTVYSLIAYKTPWCGLSFLVGMILLAGIGAAAIFRLMPNWPTKLVAAVVLAVGAGHLGWQACQLNFNSLYLADPQNPYCYAHTPMPLPRLAARLDRLAERVPEGRDLWIQVVVSENYWPLPWYLRRFNEERVGYWLDGDAWKQDRDHFPPPAILILSDDIDCDDVAARLADYGGPLNESLRPNVLIEVYFRKDLWQTYLDYVAVGDL
jgi:uncharacterized protein (TIGR03663 family)